MALYAVLGDIHGNREALEAALARAEARGVQGILCVGDLVGYNADPDECVALLRARGATCIAGNHDLIGTGRLGFERCSNKAMHSLKRTRRRLAPETARFLRELPSHHVLEGGMLLTHGGVRDVQQYMTKPRHLLENVEYLRQDFPGVRVCFFGHTHEQKVFRVSGAEVDEPFADAIAAGTRFTLDQDAGAAYFVNPGSVDASRKREHKHCELAFFDSRALALEFDRVEYDDALTESKAAAAGYRIDRWRDRVYELQRRLIGPRQMA
jgi:predicted phosphodiesterase